jgi:hypothetical protein
MVLCSNFFYQSQIQNLGVTGVNQSSSYFSKCVKQGCHSKKSMPFD